MHCLNSACSSDRRMASCMSDQWAMSNCLQVRLLIIDEVHLLNDERGPVIETLIARTQRQVSGPCLPSWLACQCHVEGAQQHVAHCLEFKPLSVVAVWREAMLSRRCACLHLPTGAPRTLPQMQQHPWLVELLLKIHFFDSMEDLSAPCLPPALPPDGAAGRKQPDMPSVGQICSHCRC